MEARPLPNQFQELLDDLTVFRAPSARQKENSAELDAAGQRMLRRRSSKIADEDFRRAGNKKMNRRGVFRTSFRRPPQPRGGRGGDVDSSSSADLALMRLETLPQAFV